MTLGLISLDQLADRIVDRASRAGSARCIVGIAGPPAAGKSTLAGELRDVINEHESAEVARVAPMDGFHLPNSKLTEEGWLLEKGQPHTFDVASFLECLRALRASATEPVVRWPEYDRKLHDPVPGTPISDQDKIVIVEGNYLLLDWPGWADVRGLLDEAWYIDIESEVAEERLYERHLRSGRTPEEARRKIAESDLPNLRLIAEGRKMADLVLMTHDGQYLAEEPV
ncbi:nucleoside triphosphate hydrolase [Nocardia sp. NPDC004722]